MNGDFFANLIARSLGHAASVQPRLLSKFEPVRRSAVALAGDSIQGYTVERPLKEGQQVEPSSFELFQPQGRESREVIGAVDNDAGERFASEPRPIEQGQSQRSYFSQVQHREADHTEDVSRQSPTAKELPYRQPPAASMSAPTVLKGAEPLRYAEHSLARQEYAASTPEGLPRPDAPNASSLLDARESIELARERDGDTKERFALVAAPVDRGPSRIPKESAELPRRHLHTAYVSVSPALKESEPLRYAEHSPARQEYAAGTLDGRLRADAPNTSTALPSFAEAERFSPLQSGVIESRPAPRTSSNASTPPRPSLIPAWRADTMQHAIPPPPRSEVLKSRVAPIAGLREPFNRVDRNGNNEPIIHVSIGRIEVRAIASEAPLKRTERTVSPVMGLDQYLRQQAKRGGR
jgi:hypothetical protein